MARRVRGEVRGPVLERADDVRSVAAEGQPTGKRRACAAGADARNGPVFLCVLIFFFSNLESEKETEQVSANRRIIRLQSFLLPLIELRVLLAPRQRPDVGLPALTNANSLAFCASVLPLVSATFRTNWL